MKKFALLFCAFLGLVALSAFTSKSNGNTKSMERSDAIQQQGQGQSVYAWRLAGGRWQQGTVTFRRTQQGFRPISYNFDNYSNGGRAEFYSDARFVPLNPNNELAKRNNWTHSISSQIGTLYLTID